jgi:acyl-CoA thioesterase-1
MPHDCSDTSCKPERHHMRKALARTRVAASGAAAAFTVSGLIALSGCGVLPQPSAVPQAAVAAGQPGASAADPGAAGSRIPNPANGRLEAVVPDIGRTVLLIGDSQSEPSDGWPRQGLEAAGYKVYYCGRGGTGFVSANGATGNYIDALRRGDWLLPSGTPALIVIQGGGNDAASGASDSRIAGNADRLIAELQDRYPGTRIAMIGTLARGEGHGGGRRTEVDALLGSVAAAHNLPFVSVGDWAHQVRPGQGPGGHSAYESERPPNPRDLAGTPAPRPGSGAEADVWSATGAGNRRRHRFLPGLTALRRLEPEPTGSGSNPSMKQRAVKPLPAEASAWHPEWR